VKAKTESPVGQTGRRSQERHCRVIDRAEIAKRGGAIEADFWVNFAPGYKAGKAISGPLITPSTDKGTHGYFPEWNAMRSTFVHHRPRHTERKKPGRDRHA